MPKYMLSVHHGDTVTLPDNVSMEQVFADVAAFNERIERGGSWVFGGGLKPASLAKVVDATQAGGTPVVTDGPYLESKEYLGGFWVVTAAGDDQAIALAKDASAACRGTVEVRPLEDEPEE